MRTALKQGLMLAYCFGLLSLDRCQRIFDWFDLRKH